MKAITTKYHGPTNTRGSRVSATDNDGNRVNISYNNALSSEEAHNQAALALCSKMGWKGELVVGSLDRGYVYVWAKGERIIAK